MMLNIFEVSEINKAKRGLGLLALAVNQSETQVMN